MSSILDALKKLEAEKAAKQTVELEEEAEFRPEAAGEDLTGTSSERPASSAIHVSPMALIVGGGAFAALLVAISVTLSIVVTRNSAPQTVALNTPPPATVVETPKLPAPMAETPVPAPVAETPKPTPPAPKPVKETAPPPKAAPDPPPAPKPVQKAEVIPPPAAPKAIQEPVVEAPAVAPAVTPPSAPAPVVAQTPEPVVVAKAVETAPPPPAVVTPPAPAPVAAQPAAVAAPKPEPVARSPFVKNTPASVTAANTPVDLESLPILRSTERVRYGLENLRLNVLREAGPNRPNGLAIINLNKVYIGEVIPGTRARLIEVKSHGIGIEIVDTGERFYVQH